MEKEIQYKMNWALGYAGLMVFRAEFAGLGSRVHGQRF